KYFRKSMLRQKASEEKQMNRVHSIAFRVLLASLVLCGWFSMRTQAQTSSPSPAASATPAAPVNPFAPQPAPPLPAGMTGSDANDPRAKLSPGMYDAGEAARGVVLKKPNVQVGGDGERSHRLWYSGVSAESAASRGTTESESITSCAKGSFPRRANL